MTAVVMILVVALALITALALAVRKLVAPATVAECDVDWVEQFSIAKYRPMQRLLTERDREFLVAQKGYKPEMWKRLQHERRRVFRSYLRNLVGDFHRLHMAARMVLVYSNQDRPELASTLLRLRVAFTMAVIAVELRLALHAVGIGQVEVDSLLGAMDAMRCQVGELAPVMQGSAA